MGVLSKHKFPPGEGYQNTSFPRGPPGEILSFEIWIRCESTSPKYEIKFITNLSHLSRNYHEIYHGSQIEGSLPSAHRGGNPVEASGCWSADGRRHIQLGSLRDLDRSPPRGCRYHQDPSRTCTGHAVASGISFACPSSSMAIVSPCKREPEKETLKFEDSFPASFSFATKRSSFDETEGMTVGSPQADHRSQ